MLMYVYGEPGSQTVRNVWGGSTDLWFQYLAEKRIIVVSVDNRGTGNRGTGFKKITYEKLGAIEVADQILAAKYLSSLSFIDQNKIGIYGWSYEGYLFSSCLFNSTIFKAAISVAPVTHWKFYDTIYTERYMDVPDSNKIRYETNAPINLIKIGHMVVYS